MYAKCFKRVIDFTLALGALLVLLLPLLILTVIGAVKMKGNPFFTQPRPGKGERVFRLIKFRTMTNEKGSDGKLLPDEQRITGYGRFLRATSLDELPELLNILIGDMAIIGPRPQLVRDMVFMTPEQRRRHEVRPGLSGLAQISGRNALKWENKLALDLEYIKNISFKEDLRIVLTTLKVVLGRTETTEEIAVTSDFGDYLLEKGLVDPQTYEEKQKEAKELLGV
ncbi:MAG: sugar transferase [Oscillospiraceae bacterium]|nr:sugar transferase [Oscillospiraceae bacterium]